MLHVSVSPVATAAALTPPFSGTVYIVARISKKAKVILIILFHLFTITNYLQIQKRKRDLTEEEVLDLINIAEGIHLKNKIHEKSIKICANLLMDNQRVAKFYFEQLDKENQTLFQSYPIWRFHSFDLENDS